MYKKKKTVFLSYLLAAGLMTALLGSCGSASDPPSSDTEAPSDIHTEIVSPSEEPVSETEEPALATRDHSDPLFAKALTADENEPALSYLPADLLQGVEATDLHPFGDRLLLIRQQTHGWEYGEDGEGGWEGDAEYFGMLPGEDPDSSREEEGDAEAFGYTFDFTVYDPWSNTLSEELHFALQEYDAYQVVGDHLLMFCYDSSKAVIYDENLTVVKEADIGDLQEVSALSFTASADGNGLYSYGYELEGGLLQVDPTDLSCTYLDAGMYSPTPETLSADGRYLILSGVDKETLRRCVSIYDTQTGQRHTAAEGSTVYQVTSADEGFLRQDDMFSNIWCYQTYDGAQSWYLDPDMTDAYLLDDKRMVGRYARTDYSTGESTTAYVLYDLDGSPLSSFRMDNGNVQLPDYLQIVTSYVYLPDCDCILFLTFRYDDHFEESSPAFIVWDLTVPAAEDIPGLTAYPTLDALKADREDLLPDSFTPTLLEDPESYNWGQLANIHNRAEQLEKQYGINIYLGPEVPSTISEYSVQQETDPEILEGALSRLEEQLLQYPDNFFPQLAYGENRDVSFYLAGHLTPNSDYVDFDPAAYVSENDHHLLMVLDSNYSWDMTYTFNHELSHMIDRRLSFLSMYRSDCLFSDSAWCAYNPENFSYLYDYIGYEQNADMQTYGNWFIDFYGMTYPTEDRAMIFGYAMDAADSSDWREVLNEDTVIYEKLGYYAQCIRDGFDTTGWDEVLPWEKYLRKAEE